ncbi:MAG: LPS assembly lipoprotein LptE [Thermoanaerobaculia bacterium]
MKKHRVAVLILSSAILSGCGYALVGRASNLPEDVRNIYIEPLINNTARLQVDQFLTRAIADEFVTRQRFKVVSSRGEADALLSGTVTSFIVRPVSFGDEGRATAYEIIIGAEMLFKRRDSGEVIWQQDRYRFQEDYELEVSETDFFDRQNEAIEEVAVKFAETLVIDILEGF